jgi:hypothetical protein
MVSLNPSTQISWIVPQIALYVIASFLVGIVTRIRHW